jgi:hypothetical protein
MNAFTIVELSGDLIVIVYLDPHNPSLLVVSVEYMDTYIPSFPIPLGLIESLKETQDGATKKGS